MAINHPQHIELRDGTITTDPRLDRLVQHGTRNFMYPAVPALVEADAPFQSRTWNLAQFLDQGNEGACVGFGCTHELLADPVEVPDLDASFAREKVYWEAQKIDPWPGGAYPGASPSYEGTSTLSGVQILEQLGYITEYRWAFDVDDLRRTLGHYGPVIIGVNWYSGMFDPDANGFIHVTGYVAGGHCLLVVGVDEEDRSFILHNSWGSNWGTAGRCKISFDDMARLLSENGDAVVPVMRVDPNVIEPIPPQPSPQNSFFRLNSSLVVHDAHEGIREEVTYATLADAIQDGCRACRVCKPKDQ